MARLVFHDGQKEIAKDRHRFRVCLCGRRFGKTTLAIYEMLGKAIGRENRHILYISTSFIQSRDIAWQEMKKLCAPVAINVNETRLEITLKTQDGGTSSIFLRGWESVESLRGQRFDFIVLDEVASMKDFYLNWQEVLRPTLTDTKGEAMFISTPKGFNHFYDLYNEEKVNPDFKSFHFTSYDNPHLAPEELDEARGQMTEDRFAQEYLADFRKMEGLVFKEFDRNRHIFDDYTARPKGIYERLCGIDWGYTNPAAILTIERDYDNCFWVTDEWYHRGRTTQEIIEAAALQKAAGYYPDPAEPDRIAELRRLGLPTRDVSNEIIAGIDSVRNLFKNNRLFIHAKCVNLILELETYAFKEKQSFRNEPEEPVKENDHAVSALRYVLHNLSAIGSGKAKVRQFIPYYGKTTYGAKSVPKLTQ